MFISIAAQGPGANKLSYILQKSPFKIFEKGNAKLFFPVNEQDKSNAVFMVEFDEYYLWNKDTPDADMYVSSRNYALSSLFCRELKKSLNTAISGEYKLKEDKEAADTPLELIIEALPIVTSLSDKQIEELLVPIGYTGLAASVSDASREFSYRTMAVDHSYKHEWMPQKTRVVGLTIKTKKTIKEVLRQLIVLINVMDTYTHYSELDSLVLELKNYGEGWLENHPKKDYITARFLRHSKKLIREINQGEDKRESEQDLEKKVNLSDLRLKWFSEQVKSLEARSVVDAGCGAGRLSEQLLKDKVFEVIAFDCDARSIRTAQHYLKNKAGVYFSSLMYYDERLAGKDVWCLMEVIEHLHPWAMDRAVDLIFGVYKPKHVLMSTPNRDYNKTWNFEPGQMRHKDHKFEWNELEASSFGQRVKAKYGYSFSLRGVGLDYVPTVAPDAPMNPGAHTVVTEAVNIAPTLGLVFSKI